MRYDIYLAGPFFTAEQKERMDSIKEILLRHALKVADPRELGPVIVDAKPEDKTPDFYRQIFEGNIEAMRFSAAILASIDDSDTGTSFELGWFHRNSELYITPIMTIALGSRKPNVMLAQCIDGHFTSLVQFEKFLIMKRPIIRNLRNAGPSRQSMLLSALRSDYPATEAGQ